MDKKKKHKKKKSQASVGEASPPPLDRAKTAASPATSPSSAAPPSSPSSAPPLPRATSTNTAAAPSSPFFAPAPAPAPLQTANLLGTEPPVVTPSSKSKKKKKGGGGGGGEKTPATPPVSASPPPAAVVAAAAAAAASPPVPARQTSRVASLASAFSSPSSAPAGAANTIRSASPAQPRASPPPTKPQSPPPSSSFEDAKQVREQASKQAAQEDPANAVERALQKLGKPVPKALINLSPASASSFTSPSSSPFSSGSSDASIQSWQERYEWLKTIVGQRSDHEKEYVEWKEKQVRTLARLRQTKDKLHQVRKEKDAIAAELESLRKQRDGLEVKEVKQSKNAEAAASPVKSKDEQLVGALREQVADLSKQLKELNQRVITANTERDKYKDEAEKLRKKSPAAGDQSDDKKTIAELNRVVAKLQEKASSASADDEKTKGLVMQWEMECAELRKALKPTQDELKLSQARCQHLTNDVSKLQKELQEAHKSDTELRRVMTEKLVLAWRTVNVDNVPAGEPALTIDQLLKMIALLKDSPNKDKPHFAERLQTLTARVKMAIDWREAAVRLVPWFYPSNAGSSDTQGSENAPADFAPLGTLSDLHSHLPPPASSSPDPASFDGIDENLTEEGQFANLLSGLLRKQGLDTNGEELRRGRGSGSRGSRDSSRSNSIDDGIH